MIQMTDQWKMDDCSQEMAIINSTDPLDTSVGLNLGTVFSTKHLNYI